MPETVSPPGHETRDVSARGAAWFALSLALSLVVIALLVGWMHAWLDQKGPAWPRQSTAQRPLFRTPPPTLQELPTTDLKTFEAAEDEKAHGYSWVDQKSGVIRIPIERAEELILQRGLPATSTAMPLPGPQVKPNPGGATP